MNLYRAQAHSDPLYPIQPSATTWHLDELHARSIGRQVRVAIIDSGVQQDHPDLLGKIESRQNFVADHADAAERHGTEVAGIIAARADDGVGIVGIAPGARLLALRACWQESEQATLCTSLSLALALDFAIAHDARVINLSLSGPPDRLLGRLIEVAVARGIAVVAALDRNLPGGGFPASRRGVLAVADEGGGAVAGDALLAPGHDIPTSGPPSRWYLVSGTSYAAAHVSGLMALLDEPGAVHNTASATVAAIARRADGSVDACATLSRRFGTCTCSCGVVTGATAPLLPQ
jgi:subtilisin family serine protease